MRQHFDLILTDKSALTSHVQWMTFQAVPAYAWAFQPGQFCQLYIPEGETFLTRSYSVATPPGQATFSLAIGSVAGGKATQYLFSRQIGDRIKGSGFYGRMTLPTHWSEHQRLFLVGTGTGVAPYRSMLLQIENFLSQKSLRIKIYLLQGQRTVNDLLFHQDFLSLAERYSNFHYLPCVSRDAKAEHVYHGYVQDALLEYPWHPITDHIYLCGNPNMIETLYQRAQSSGLHKVQVKREKFF